MSVEDKKGTVESSGGGTALVGTGVVDDFESDDEENSDTGRITLNFKSREGDGQESGQSPPRPSGGVFGRRQNDKGEQMVLTLLRVHGLEECSDWFFKSLAEATLRNYRRGFTMFYQIISGEHLDISEIKSVDMALSMMVRALKVSFQKKLKLSAVSLMKTAMVRVFEFIFNVQFANLPIFRMAMKFYTSDNLPRKEFLRLQWSVDTLLKFIMKKSVFKDQGFNELVGVCSVLCMAFTALRFTEMYKLNMNATDPDHAHGFWKLWTQVKGHNYLEPVFLHVVEEPNLNPVAALLELRNRIRVIDGKEDSFWHRLESNRLIPLTYDELRGVAAQVLKEAGIEENRPYHIKHAVMTCLDESGVSAKDIAAFARHRFESMAQYKHYVSYDGGKKNVSVILNRVKN
jgi:site-specific recombinase XerD